jgi:FlaA1/EpsC-like NDP-sugar epimerase
MKLNWRALIAFLHDVAACALAWLAAFYLRFNLELPEPYDGVALTTLAWIVPINIALFFAFGLYRGVWRFASLPDLRRIIFAISVAALAAPALLAMLQIAVPRSVLIISPLLQILAMGGSRFAYRAWKEGRINGIMHDEREPVFVIGAADAAVNLVKELARSTQWQVVGIFDDDKTMKGSELQGVRVLGKLDQMPSWKTKLGVSQAILAMPEASHTQRRIAIDICARAGLQVQTVPSCDDLLSGKVTV